MHPELETHTIGLSDIAVLPDRHRELNPQLVEKLAESMKARGLINPITVRPNGPNAGYILVAGRHRFEAAKKLEWDSISAVALEGIDALDAEEIELRENLDRGELTPAEISIASARLKAIKEAGYRLKAAGRNTPQEPSVSQVEKRKKFGSNTAKIVAKETGRSVGAIERDDSRVKHIPRIAETVRTSLDKGVELDALAKLSPQKQEEIISRAVAGQKVSAQTELQKQARDVREAELADKIKALPDKKYGVIYADPPWKLEAFPVSDRAAENHYPTQETDDISTLDVASIAARDCELFLWATGPMLLGALKVMQAWGFEYKSHVVWHKDKMGLGNWFRNKHEILLVGVKGKPPTPARGQQRESVILAEVRKHGEKPEIFYEMIEAYLPSLPKIELYVRGPARKGWDMWGNEAQPESQPDEKSRGEDSTHSDSGSSGPGTEGSGSGK